MYSISEVSKITNLTARSLRHYEEKGLLSASYRGTNGYRYYDEKSIEKISEIKKLKEMNFSLEEIKSFLIFQEQNLKSSLSLSLNEKLASIEKEILRLSKSKNKIENQILATEEFFKGNNLKEDQRRVLMETIKSEILNKLKDRKKVSKRDLEYLRRENYLIDSEDKREFINAVKKCYQFAKQKGIKLGAPRGAAPALLSLYALGISDVDPSEINLIPERFYATDLNLHIDVEYENGSEFIRYCKKLSSSLKVGKIEAFKLPILNIIENVHRRIGYEINYQEIDNNDPIILNLFRNGDIEKIFSFDFPKETLMAKHFDNRFYNEGRATNMLSEYLKSQVINDYSDLLNIEAVFRPDNLDKKPFMKKYIERYPKAKKKRHYYECLTASLNEYLTPNYGVIIYQEDIIEVIKEYTGWDYLKCNYFRRALGIGSITQEELQELASFTGTEVLELLIRESPVVFCKAHSRGAWSRLIKKTSVLKALHKDIYYEEISKWESINKLSWADFGFISGELSLLQQ